MLRSLPRLAALFLVTAAALFAFGTLAAAQPVARAAAMQVPLTVPLVVDNIGRDQIDVLIELAENNVHAKAETLLAEIGPALTDDRRQELERRVDPQGNLTLEDLHAIGVDAEFDLAELELLLRIPPDARATTQLRLRSETPPAGMGTAVPPARLSGFLNYRTGLEYEDDGTKGKTQPLILSLDGALNYEGWALEGAGSIRELGKPAVTRSETRIVRDFPDRELRFQLGDLSYRTRGFQTSAPMGGIAIAKESALQPYRMSRPSGQAGFFLDEPSTVEFLVNDRTLRTMRLPPGPYNASSFPFIGGINDLRIVITGDSGARRVIEFPFTFDGGLLNPGEAEYVYAIGFPSRLQDGEIRYDTSQAQVSLFHRLGLTEALMLEANFQADEKVAMTGAGVLAATPIGLVRTDAAVTMAERTDGRDRTGFSVRTQYEYRDGRPSNTAGRVWVGSIGYISPTFAAVGAPDLSNPVEWNIGARYSQRLFDFGLGIGVDYQIGRDDRRETVSTTFQVQRNLSRDASLTVLVRDEISVEGQRSQGAFISFSIKPGGGDGVYAISRDTASASTRADWRFIEQDDTRGIGGFAAVEHSRQTDTANVDLQYAASRSAVGLALSRSEPRVTGVESSSSAALRLSGAVAYADGAWGLSRRIGESFAILTPHASLRDYDLGVNPIGVGKYQATMDDFGPAVLPSLVPYRQARATVDARELPIGLNVGRGAFDMAPTYKRGTRVTVGTGATVFLLATIGDVDGTPLSLQAGRIISLDDPDFEPALLFTNRVGRIAIEGLRPGRYRIEFLSNASQSIELRIPDDAAGQYDAGGLVLPGKTVVATR